MAGSRPSEDLDAIRHDAKSPGDRTVIREIREAGSRTARERILDLLDDGSFVEVCLLYTSPSPRDQRGSRMPSSA